MPVMNTGTIPLTLEYVDPAVRSFYQEVSDDFESVYDKIFTVMMTDKAWVQDVPMAGLGPMRRSSEGQAVEFDQLYEGDPATYVLNKYHHGFALTEEAKLFNKAWPLLEHGTKAMAVSAAHTKEMVCADLFNKGFTSTYVGGDGKALFASDHPYLRPDAPFVSGAATGSNRPAIDYQFGEAGLEQMAISIRRTTDESGFYSNVRPDRLVVPPELEFEVVRVLKSVGRVGSSDNDVNALKALGILQKDPIVWPYLTNPKAFFMLNKQFAGPGLKVYLHRDVDGKPRVWVDNATGNTYVRNRVFIAPGWSAWRAVYGSAGTA